MDDDRPVGVADAAGERADGGNARPTVPMAIPDYSTLSPTGARPTPMGVVGVVAVKIVGLYCFVQALPFLYLIPMNLFLLFSRQGYSASDLALNLLHPTLYLAAGVLLVRWASWVATRVLGFEQPSEDDARPAAPGRRLQTIAFSVLGLWLVLGGLVELVRLFVQARYLPGPDDVIQSALEEPSELFAAFVRVGLGIWLFFGSKRLASFWRRFRMDPARADTPAA
ncbi:MAG: hypothetical protein AVDCRST_MAG64-174 [uncultured Phycisphaerae bacterium]|uniref:Uncharacterized protein n=1 Tax=uncultured Phycisphaerae bacterium TaxID=904963 RepID=A0A6J4N0G8_9BACT|nr:MAG: hypothetical protein AVDCRST_MAG64-174 [uncultured Phycisphaerae bacterium]